MTFEKGHKRGGRPPGTPNKKKLLKVKDFVILNDIDVPRLWFESIMATPPGPYRAKLLEAFHRSYEAPPKQVDTTEEMVSNTLLDVTDSVDILQIANNTDKEVEQSD